MTKFKPKNKTEEFYHDIFVTFCEDNLSVFRTIEYKYDAEKPFAVVEDMEDDNKQYRIDLDTVKKAFGLVEKHYGPSDKKNPLEVHMDYLRRMNAAHKELDAGLLDTYDAMTLMQFALFGKAIYG
jgi:hypothetical protein